MKKNNSDICDYVCSGKTSIDFAASASNETYSELEISIIEKHQLSKNQFLFLKQYLIELLNLNKQINLTNIKEYEQALILHIDDSLAPLPYIVCEQKKLIDIGSGCGFPGVALCVAGKIDTTLIDSVNKKMLAVSTLLDKTKIKEKFNVKCVSNRIETYATERPLAFDYVTARALSSLPSILELASPSLKEGGLFFAYKAKIDNNEWDAAQAVMRQVGFDLLNIDMYKLIDEKTERELFVFKKTRKPQIKLPRRVGLAQKRPLK